MAYRRGGRGRSRFGGRGRSSSLVRTVLRALRSSRGAGRRRGRRGRRVMVVGQRF